MDEDNKPEDGKFENPTPKKGEKKKDYIKRCIPIVHAEHPTWEMDKVRAVCYNLWDKKHKNMLLQEGYELFTDSAIFFTTEKSETKNILEQEQPSVNEQKRNIIAIFANRFMNGGYVSEEELKKCYKKWENTLHDLNHMGTSTGYFLAQQDISYFVGWHTNVKYDEDTKSVSMELNIDSNVPRSKEWEGYISLCEKAGQIPNVSVTYLAKRSFIALSTLPPEVQKKAKEVGYGKEDLVPILNNITPVCVTTCFMGRCGDKDGCGIRNTDSKCGSKSCDCEKINAEREELIKRIKEKQKQLSED